MVPLFFFQSPHLPSQIFFQEQQTHDTTAVCAVWGPFKANNNSLWAEYIFPDRDTDSKMTRNQV